MSTGEGTGAIDGKGVYLTSMTPNNSARDVLLNNYDQHIGFEGRTAKHIRIETAILDRNLLKKSAFPHDAYVYRAPIVGNIVPYPG